MSTFRTQNLGVCCDGSVTLSNGGATATVTVGDVDVVGGDAIQLVVTGVQNGASSTPFAVATSSDPTQRTPSLGPLPGASIGSPKVRISSTASGATKVNYVLDFVGTQPLVDGTSTITISGPPGTVFPTPQNPCVDTDGRYSIQDTTTGDTNGPYGQVICGGGSSVTMKVEGFNAPAGDALRIVIDDVTNGSETGPTQLTISDAAAAAPFTLVGMHSVGHPTVRLSSTAAGVNHVRYRLSFVASSSGGLRGGGFSTITIAAPAGTVFPGSGYSILDTTTGDGNGPYGPGIVLSNGGATVTMTPVPDIASGDHVLVTIDGVKNAPAGTKHLAVATSSDTPALNTPFTIVAPHAVSAVRVRLSSQTAGAAGVEYSVHFVVSSSGGLIGGNQSTITLNAPVGTVFPGSGYSILDTTTGEGNGPYGPGIVLSNGGATVTMTPVPDIASADDLLITISGVTNAPSPGSKQLGIATSSDTVLAAGSYNLT